MSDRSGLIAFCTNNADLVLVMEAGRIVEQGDHSEVLAAGGAFAELDAAQGAALVAEV